MPLEPVHTYAHDYAAPFRFPSTARAGRHAARLWFQSDTKLTAAQFRDLSFRDHCGDRVDTPAERKVRLHTFRLAFAEAVGNIVVEEGRFRATAS